MDGYDGDDEYDHRSLTTKKKLSQLFESSRINVSKYVVAPILTISTIALLGLSYYMLMVVILPFFGGWTKIIVGFIATFLLYSAAYFYVMLLKTHPGAPPALVSKRGTNDSNQSAQPSHNNSLKSQTTRVNRKPRTKKKGQKKPSKRRPGIKIDTTHKFDQFPKRDEYNGEDNAAYDDDDEDDDSFDIYNAGKIDSGKDEYSNDTGICHKCTSLKVPRSHHCKTCDACILKMDHHCSWVGKCVGYYNYRFYLMFIFYVTNYCFVFFMFSLPPYLLRSSKLSLNPHYNEKLMFFLIVMSFCLGLSVFFLCSFHLLLICTNQTTIEFFKNLRSGPLSVENRIVPRKSRFDFTANPYHLGEYRNICEALNVPKNGWIILSLLPNVHRPPTGNGSTFKHSKLFQQINCV